MGTSNIQYFNGRYKGSLSDQQCSILDTLISLKEEGGSVPDIVHCIYCLDDYTVDRIIEEYTLYKRILNKDYEKPLGSLANYQTISVACMYYAVNCILGDSVGMGKTVEVSGLLNLLKREKGDSFRYLFLAEKKGVSQVHRELIKFTGDYATIITSAEQRVLKDFMLWNPATDRLDYSVVGTHALIKSDTFLSWLKINTDTFKISPFDILIVDESSFLGGKKTDFVKYFKVISKYFKRIVFLNATPFETSLEIFYRQLDLLDNKFMPTKANFDKEYCIMDYHGMYPKPSGRYKNTKQFKKSIAYRYFASTRKGNGAIMQDCDGGIKVSTLSKVQKRLLNETSIPRLVFDCPNALDSSIEFNEENVPKLKSLRELLENECKNTLSVLLFVYYKEAQYSISEWLHERGYSNRILNGDNTFEESNIISTEFKNGDFKVLITNVQKCLNFGHCDYCIFYSVEPNTSKMIQFEGRMTRSFDIYGKHVYILCSKGKEYNNLTKVISGRASAMRDVTEVDYSIVLDILLGGKS